MDTNNIELLKSTLIKKSPILFLGAGFLVVLLLSTLLLYLLV